MKRIFLLAVLCVMLSAFSAYGDELADLISAAEAGNPVAQHELGWLYVEGDGGAKQDKELGFKWVEKAAAQGYAPAECNLGYLYEKGIGTNVHHIRSMEFYTMAAEKGNVTAQRNLGIRYANGEYVQKNLRQAIYWFKKAAAKGDQESAEALKRLSASKAVLAKQQKAPIASARNEAAKNSQSNDEPAPKDNEDIANIPVQQKTSESNAKNTSSNTKKPQEKPKVSKNSPAKQKTSASNTQIRASLTDDITSEEADNSRPKPRLTVQPFKDKCSAGEKAADAIMDLMVTELSKAGIFTLLERHQLDQYVGSEIRLGQSGLMDSSTAPKLGNVKGIQYLMTGAITCCYYSEKGSGIAIPILGIVAVAKTAYVVINIRIIDISTSEIIYAFDQTGEYRQKSDEAAAAYRGFFIGSYNKKAGGLLEQAALDSVKKHVSAIKALDWPN